MAKQVTKTGPITPEEQAFINKHYEKTSGEKMKPGTIAEISEEDLKIMRSGKGGFATYYMGKKLEQPKKEVVPKQVTASAPKQVTAKAEPVKPVERKPIVKAVVEQKPAKKISTQDTRGYNKAGQQKLISKIAEKTTGQQTFRRGLETAANNLLKKSESSLRFKKALKDQVIKKK